MSLCLFRAVEKLFYHSHICRLLVIRQAVDEDASVLFFQDAVVEQDEKAAVVERADQASESLFQGDDSCGDLILKECVAAVGVDCFHASGDDRIAGNREGQAVDDDATQLLALYVDSLPQRRGGEQDGVRREAELFQEGILRSVSLYQ